MNRKDGEGGKDTRTGGKSGMKEERKGRGWRTKLNWKEKEEKEGAEKNGGDKRNMMGKEEGRGVGLRSCLNYLLFQLNTRLKTPQMRKLLSPAAD